MIDDLCPGPTYPHLIQVLDVSNEAGTTVQETYQSTHGWHIPANLHGEATYQKNRRIFYHRFVSPWMVPKGGYLEQFCQLNLTFLIYFIYFINFIYLICFAMFCNCRYQATSSALRHLNLSNCCRRPALITATSEPFTEESAQRLLNIAPKKLEASGLRRFTRKVSYRLSAKHWISTVMAIYQLLVISGIIHSINGVISTYNW